MRKSPNKQNQRPRGGLSEHRPCARPLLNVPFFCLVAALLGLSPATVFAQEPGVSNVGEDFAAGAAPRVIAEMEPVPRQHRTGAAFLVNWSLRWTGQGLVDGRLAFMLYDHEMLLSEFKSDQLVLDKQERRFSTMIPAQASTNASSEIVVRPTFVTERKSFDLGEFPLRLPQRTERTLVVAAADAWGIRQSAGNAALERSLSLEQFHPKSIDVSMATVVAQVPLEQFGEDPLEYCVFDVVLAVDEAFSRLRERQLNALLKWVDAGGSILVLPSPSLSAAHLDFLNKTAPGDAGTPRFHLGNDGKLIGIPAAGQRQITLFRKGLGRVAVVLENSPRSAEFNDVAWRELVWFLWKGRDDLRSVIRDHGEWPPNLLALAEAHVPQPWQDVAGIDPNVRATYLRSGGWLLDFLVPTRVQMMPLEVMALVLTLYVIVVGPVDYFLLGLLRLRKFTWVVFPVVTLGFAFFTLWLSERYMATDDQRRGAVFLDVIDGGQIARANRVELLLTSSHGVVDRAVSRTLFTPLAGTFGESADYQNFHQSNMGTPYDFDGDASVASATIVGTVPDRYRILQRVRKWTPQLNRMTTIAPDEYAANFDWNAVTTAELAVPESRIQLMPRLIAAFGKDVSAHAIHGTEIFHLGGRVFDIPPPLSQSYLYAAARAEGNQPKPRSFFHEVCVAPPRGMFAIVSQLSPTGGDNFEDFAVLDPSDGRRWLLVVGVPRGNDLLFYRKEILEAP